MTKNKQRINTNKNVKLVFGIFLATFILFLVIAYVLGLYKGKQLAPLIVKPFPTPSVSIVSGWIAYILPDEKIKMQYPPTWSLEVVSSQSSYTLVSPNNFKLTFLVNLDGLGGGCDGECPEHNIKNEVIDTLNFYDVPLYLVVNGAKDNFFRGIKPFIQFNVIPRKNCYFNICYGFNGKNTPGATIISGSFETFMPTEQFIQSSDVQTAVKILKTLTY